MKGHIKNIKGASLTLGKNGQQQLPATNPQSSAFSSSHDGGNLIVTGGLVLSSGPTSGRSDSTMRFPV